MADLSDADLIAYWPLDEGTGTTSADASGNGHTLTRGSTAQWDTSALKKFGAAALAMLNVNALGASFAPINLGTVHTIAFWINGWDGSNDGIAIGGEYLGNLGYYAGYIDTTSIYYSAATGNYATVPHGGLTGSHHIAFVRNGTTITFYKDGVSRGTGTLLNNDNFNLWLSTLLSYPLPFGGGGGEHFSLNATIDDVRFYGVAATAAQVAALYAYIPGGGSSQTLSLPALASTAVVRVPTLTVSPVTLGLPVLASTAVVDAPSVTPGSATLALPALASRATVAPPSLSTASVTLGLPPLTTTATLAAPTLTPGTATVTLPRLTTTATLTGPTLTPGLAALVLPVLASPTRLWPPVVADASLTYDAIRIGAVRSSQTGAAAVRSGRAGVTTVRSAPTGVSAIRTAYD